jgi:hypothetical protein
MRYMSPTVAGVVAAPVTSLLARYSRPAAHSFQRYYRPSPVSSAPRSVEVAWHFGMAAQRSEDVAS